MRLVLCLLLGFGFLCRAEETAFTYAGNFSGQAASLNGLYDLHFELFDEPDARAERIAGPIVKDKVPVTNGMFMVHLNFGNVFDGGGRWLRVGYRPGIGYGEFLTSEMFHPISAVPFAVHASTAGALISTGAVQAARLSVGQSHLLLGEFASIAGGLNNHNFGAVGTISGGYNNAIHPNTFYSSVAGGSHNQIENGVTSSAIAGGSGNQIQRAASWSIIEGGANNLIQTDATYSAIHGGHANRISSGATHSLVAGGFANLIQSNATYATIAGGGLNRAGGSYSFAAGCNAHALHGGSFVWSDTSAGEFQSSGRGQFLVRAMGGVGIGLTRPTSPLTVAGRIESTEGGFKFPDGTIQKTAFSFSANIPIGAVIEWWRPAASIPLPEGYQTCDGNTVTDRQSPLFGHAVPALVSLQKAPASPAGAGPLCADEPEELKHEPTGLLKIIRIK